MTLPSLRSSSPQRDRASRRSDQEHIVQLKAALIKAKQENAALQIKVEKAEKAKLSPYVPQPISLSNLGSNKKVLSPISPNRARRKELPDQPEGKQMQSRSRPETAREDQHLVKESSTSSTIFSTLGALASTPAHLASQMVSPRPTTQAAAGAKGAHRAAGPALASLTRLGALGEGGYGKVTLVRESSKLRVYALKKISKETLLTKNGLQRCKWLWREKEILEEIDEHPFIVKLYATYADELSISLLLGVGLGGDLFRLLEELSTLPDHMARFYSASLALALAHLHQHCYVYRDVKLENVLIDAQGFVKLCDFGFVKKIDPGTRSHTWCGTEDYMAPEMILNLGVDFACDWWGLGILTFELIQGSAPFTDVGGNPLVTQQNILGGDIASRLSESQLSLSARKLCAALCTVEVERRLGSSAGAKDAGTRGGGGGKEVLKHEWFVGSDPNLCENLVNHVVKPPWRPQLASVSDTSCFDDVRNEEESSESEVTFVKRTKQPPAAVLKQWNELQRFYSRPLAGGWS